MWPGNEANTRANIAHVLCCYTGHKSPIRMSHFHVSITMGKNSVAMAML